MNPFAKPTTCTSDDFAAELADTALQVAAHHGMRVPSVDVELELWHALAAALHGQRPSCNVLGQATDIAYQTLLSHRPTGAFLDLELGLWRAFRSQWPSRSDAPGPMPC